MIRKVLMSIASVIVIAVAAVNVNMSMLTERVPNVSLENVQALANSECIQSGLSLLSLSDYKVAITNTDKRGGVAIRNSNQSTLNSYGLDVEQNVFSGRTSNIAIRAYAVSPSSLATGRAYGVYATAGNASSGYNYGVFANLAGCQNGTALYATSDDSKSQQVDPGRYAGYFQGHVRMMGGNVSIGDTIDPSYTLNVQGNVHVNGSLLTTSDSRYKTHVKNLGSSLEKISRLRPVTYHFKPDDLSAYYSLVPDSVEISDEDALRSYFGLGAQRDLKRTHIGFIAQELQTVFPELVYCNGEGLLSVDYVALIPVLARAVQEQQAILQKQDATIQMLISRLESLERNTNKADQEQNFSFSLLPNPANAGFVTIDYNLNVDASIGIDLYNLYGQKLKVLVPQQSRHAGSYSVQASVSDLNTGPYIVRATSGDQIESKQLIIK